MQSHGALEIFASHVFERTDFHDAGVVDQEIDSAEPVDDLPHSSVDLIGIEQVAFDSHNFATAPGEIGFRARELFAIAGNESNTPALLTDVSRQHETETARSATDQGDFVAQRISRCAKGTTR
jgi:hypothetical protein